MAAKKPKGGQAQDMELPDDFVPRQAVENPIITSAYKEPDSHWFYAKGSSTAEKVPGRRPAQYWFKTKRITEVQEGELFAEEESDLLPLVNALRKDVKRWRESGYRCNNNVTKTLLNHWRRADAARPIFFCQLEAVETIIYILEFGLPGQLARTGYKSFDVSQENFTRLFAARELDQTGLVATNPLGGRFNKDLYPRLIDPSGRAGEQPLRRLGCKMATGSGKTTVMAMLIAWAFCNRGEKPESKEFPNAVLVCAPNLTVKKRLQVLCPENEDNYYKQFELIPSQYTAHMAKGKVLVTNWHTLAERSIHGEGGHKVVDLGKESNEAFAQNRLGELARQGQILVLNDEGHHCWRPKALSEEEKRAIFKDLTPDEIREREEEQEEARVWLEGLDKINNSGLAGRGQDGALLPGVLACVDLSATPFYLGNSGFPEGSPFHWLVSDFGLVDAIECGITKVPRLPIKDDTGAVDAAGQPDPKYFRLWAHIKAQAKKTDYNGKRLKPEFIYIQAEDALQTIASQWKAAFDDIELNHPGATPPVLIIVCDTTDTAKLFFEYISGQTVEDVLDAETGKTESVVRYGVGKLFPEHLSNTKDREVTIRIDSRMLDEIDPDAGDTKDAAALRLREIVHTVGKKGKPGEHIRCVVSVSMLTEGWDANTVTHILGIRAFGTQLLCEQVVGRGLRRRSYEPDPATGLLPPEYVDVYGIPFSLIPYKGQAKTAEKVKDSVYTYIHSMDERKDFEIKFPNVEGFTHELRDSQIECDVDAMEIYDATSQPVAHEVWVQAAKGMKETLGGEPESHEVHDRQEYYAAIRPQEVIFSLASRVMQRLLAGDSGNAGTKVTEAMVNRARLMPELVGIVQQYVQRRVKYPEASNGVPNDCRLLALEIHAREVVARIHDNILPKAAKDGEGRLLPVLSRFLKYHSTEGASFNTTLKTIPLSKSHLNRAPVNGYEEAAINELEECDAVACYTPNHKALGFSIAYTSAGEVHAYFPDIIIKLRNGTTLVVEIKGVGGRRFNPDAVNAKNAAARKWCSAVSNLGNLGKWVYRICDGDSPGEMLTELRKVLAEAGAGSSEKLPYTIVQPQHANLWTDCVPLRSLRSVAGQGRAKAVEPTDLIEGLTDYPLVTWNGRPQLSEGMFVARVPFGNLGEAIPPRCHALFKLVDSEDCSPWIGKLVLLRTRGITDVVSGDEWTLRTLKLGRGPDEHNQNYRYDLEAEDGTVMSLTTDIQGKIPVLAEFVCVLPAAS